MQRIVAAMVTTVCALLLGVVIRAGEGGQAGWKIPPAAAAEKSPLTVNEGVISAGRKLFVAKCQRCHGPQGKGDGPDATGDHPETMDLTSAKRAPENPDGVVFHKVWNGRVKPRMPAFSSEMSREQVWALVAYVQTLRAAK